MSGQRSLIECLKLPAAGSSPEKLQQGKEGQSVVIT